MFDDEFLKTGMQIIFEDNETGEAFNVMELSANSIFDLLDNNNEDNPFNIKLIMSNDEYYSDTKKIKMNIDNNDADDALTIKVKPEENDTVDLKMNIPDNEVLWKPQSKITGKDDDNAVNLKMNIPTVELTDNSTMKIDDNNIEKFKLKINNKDSDFVNLKMNISKNDSNSVETINLKIKKEELNLNLNDNEDLKNLLKDDNPPQLLINCLNILKDGKSAIDRLIVLVPNDEILVKTQNIVVELIGRINDDYEILLKNKEKCKELAVNVAKFILDLKTYLKIKFVDFKNDVDETSHTDNVLDNKIDKVKNIVKNFNLKNQNSF